MRKIKIEKYLDITESDKEECKKITNTQTNVLHAMLNGSTRFKK